MIVFVKPAESTKSDGVRQSAQAQIQGGAVAFSNCQERSAPALLRLGLRGRTLLFAVALTLSACATPRLPAPDEDREAVEEFRQNMSDYASTTARMLEQTRHGTNLSQMTLGWFAYDLLSVLSSQDDALNQHFNADGSDLQSYMKTAFQDNPATEIARLEALTRNEHASRRQAARYALEILRHVPNSGASADAQAAERRDLAAALASLQEMLQRTASDLSL
jgi:hypothetical protein